MKLNILKLKDDIVGDRSEMFLTEFPEAKVTILDLKSRPNCAICIRNAVMALMDNEKYQEKLELIYGEVVELEQDMLKLKEKGELELKRVDVFRCRVTDWEEIATDYMKRNGSRVEYITTAYDPTNEEIIATVFLKNTTVKAPNKRREHLPVAPTPAPADIAQQNVPNVRRDAPARSVVSHPNIVPETGSGPSIDDDPNIRLRRP
jgi:hypothetical protein